ncbi:MAG: rhomboid family intramembrane serine protease [Anaerolineaceae bacterium]
MIPIRDEIRTRRIPYVNYALIAINVLVFLWMFLNSGNLDQIYAQYALVPANFSIINMFTSMFMHGGWMHLLGNMLYLWIFGDNIEDRFGHAFFLLFYLAGGVAAALLQVAINPSSTVPMVGASGAIAAVLGAYIVIYPHSRVYTFVPIGYFARLTLVPAIIVLGLWFLLQLLSGVGSLGAPDQGGTAYFAHIGGSIFGLIMGWLFKGRGEEPQPAPPNWN